MSVQSILNNQAINKLTNVSKAISIVDSFERNQMYNYTLRQICNSNICLEDMTDTQLNNFDISLVEAFKYREWI